MRTTLIYCDRCGKPIGPRMNLHITIGKTEDGTQKALASDLCHTCWRALAASFPKVVKP